MKANIWLLGAILASSTLVTTAHADNATRVAATSALGSVVACAVVTKVELAKIAPNNQIFAFILTPCSY